MKRVYCAISCRIGSPLVRMCFLDERLGELRSCERELKPDDAIGMFKLREPVYANLCKGGLFQCLQA